MLKTILYTSNPDFVPTNLGEIMTFAERENKYYTCLVNDDSQLADIRQGAHIVTSKGNHCYVLDVFEGLRNLEGSKRSNIVSPVSVEYPFEEKECLEVASKVRLLINGKIAVQVKGGTYAVVNDDNTVSLYPKALTLDVPVYVVPKALSKVSVGDVIITGDQYAKVIEKTENEVKAINYSGIGVVAYPVKCGLADEAIVKVVSDYKGLNPLYLLSVNGNKEAASILPFLMNGGLGDVNPFILSAFLSKGNNNVGNPMLLAMLLSGKCGCCATKEDKGAEPAGE